MHFVWILVMSSPLRTVLSFEKERFFKLDIGWWNILLMEKDPAPLWAPDMLASSRYQDLVVHPKWCRILSINPMIKLNEIQTCSSMDLSAIIQQLLTFELCCVHWGFFSQSTAGVVSFCWGCSGAPFRDLKRIISLISWVCWKTILLGTDIPPTSRHFWRWCSFSLPVEYVSFLDGILYNFIQFFRGKT